MTTIIQSILALKSDAQVRINDEDISTLVWVDDNPTNITNPQITNKQLELKTKAVEDETNAINKKASGKQKLLDLGLSEEEVKALIGL